MADRHPVLLGLIRGWCFTPLRGKRPVTKGWTTAPKPTPRQVFQWTAEGNLGLRTGSASGVVVLDVDAAKGGRVPEGLPETVTVQTGGGGLHLYFQAPEDVEVGNSVGKLAPHVDVRGEGGVVAYVGSTHPETGKTYGWMPGRSPEDVALAPWPLRLRPQAPGRNVRAAGSGRGKYENAAQTVREAEQGTRNDTLYRETYALAVAEGPGLDREALHQELLEAARASGLDPKEARATVASAVDSATGGWTMLLDELILSSAYTHLPGNAAKLLTLALRQARLQGLRGQPEAPFDFPYRPDAGMSEPTFVKARRTLVEYGFLNVYACPSGERHRFTLCERWREWRPRTGEARKQALKRQTAWQNRGERLRRFQQNKAARSACTTPTQFVEQLRREREAQGS